MIHHLKTLLITSAKLYSSSETPSPVQTWLYFLVRVQHVYREERICSGYLWRLKQEYCFCPEHGQYRLQILHSGCQFYECDVATDVNYSFPCFNFSDLISFCSFLCSLCSNYARFLTFLCIIHASIPFSFLLSLIEKNRSSYLHIPHSFTTFRFQCNCLFRKTSFDHNYNHHPSCLIHSQVFAL